MVYDDTNSEDDGEESFEVFEPEIEIHEGEEELDTDEIEYAEFKMKYPWICMWYALYALLVLVSYLSLAVDAI